MTLSLFDGNGMATREAMMYAATEHADRVSPKWSDVAYRFLENYARTHGNLITGEEVTQAARAWGLSEPSTTRAWGSLYQKAQRQKIIVYVDSEAKRYNGSPAPRYRSLVYRVAV